MRVYPLLLCLAALGLLLSQHYGWLLFKSAPDLIKHFGWSFVIVIVLAEFMHSRADPTIVYIKSLATAAILTFIGTTVIEVNQIWQPERQFELLDIGANISGLLTAAVICTLCDSTT